MADQQVVAYAALLLHDSGVEVNAANLAKVVAASGIQSRATISHLYAGYIGAHPVSSLIAAAGNAQPAAAAAAAPAAAAGAPAAGAAAGKKKEEKKAESEGDDEMGFGLFD